MRLSRLFEVTFVGALMFTPAIAQEIEQVHEKALQVLREQQGKDIPPTQSTPAPSVANPGVDSRTAAFEKFKADNARARAEREAQMKAGVAEAAKVREQQQEKKRQELQEFLQQRDELRQRQREYDANAVREAGALKGQDAAASKSADVHSKALEVLRGEQAAAPSSPPRADAIAPSASTAAAAAEVSDAEVNARAQQIMRERNAVVSEAEVAPRVLAQNQGSVEDTHSKALESTTFCR